MASINTVVTINTGGMGKTVTALLFVLSIQEYLFGKYCGFKQFEHGRAFDNHVNKSKYNF